jgi:hypothetical protein
LEGKKSVEDNVVTHEIGLPFNSSMISFHIWLFKKIDTNIAKQCLHVEFPYCLHVEFPYFVMGSHLGKACLLVSWLQPGLGGCAWHP